MMAPTSPEALGRVGRFSLVRRIGAGGMGEIFLARDESGREVAIKRLLRECAKDPVFIGMFLDEARLAESLEHPNICRVFEHGQDGQHYFLVMEHIDGPSLKELLARRGAGLPFPLASRIVAEVASGLDYAHRLTDPMGRSVGIVHRDVSPANIMVARDGRVKIVDFGLAKARTQLMKTQPGLVKGKFGYLAPEQLGGQVDWRTDLFALGLCLYEALTAEQLFGEKSAAETVQAIGRFSGPPPLAGHVPGVPAALDEVLRRALSPEPTERFESAAAFRAALGQAVVQGGHGAVSAEALAHEVSRSSPTKHASAPPPRLTAPELGHAPSDAPPATGWPPWPLIGALGAAGILVLLAGMLWWWLA
ncbi:MAG TPA: serine/threonine-protein kinase [Sandaracinaceae bacterium LLY-WYZ-13_1]|nr:serine/threonine-protein kinase [Sandaracinaceae bacterium LLY-WYZ-13_1]